jgi:g-D-glutamyl-meso-diaminopimelate peptidase
MQLIRKGATGPAVKDIQTLLNNLITIVPKLIEDGIFGSRTQAAVLQFQRQNGLSADGIVGPRTSLALFLSTGERLKRGSGATG